MEQRNALECPEVTADICHRLICQLTLNDPTIALVTGTLRLRRPGVGFRGDGIRGGYDQQQTIPPTHLQPTVVLVVLASAFEGLGWRGRRRDRETERLDV